MAMNSINQDIGMDDILSFAKTERMLYEYDYRQNPKLAANIIQRNMIKSQKWCLFPHTEHALSVLNELLEIGCAECSIYDNPESLLSADKIALIGYWNDIGINDFCTTYNIDRNSVFLPYCQSEMMNDARSVETEIDLLHFGGDKPELVLVVQHEGRDFITNSAHEIEKYFRLTKIYIGKQEECKANKYFDQIISLGGNTKSLEHFFNKWGQAIAVCCVFTHGMDFWKIPYVHSMLNDDTKLVVLSCDWGWCSYDGEVGEVAQCVGRSFRHCEIDMQAELYAAKKADIIITNRDFTEEMPEVENKAIVSFAFMDTDKFVFRPSRNANIKCCFVGSLFAHNIQGLFGSYFNIENIFTFITKTDITIDIFEGYGRDLLGGNSQYRELADSKRLKVMPSLPHDCLPEALSGYDFGLLLYNLSQEWLEKFQYLIKNLIQGKFMTYLSSGIPVVVSAEFCAMSNIVQQFKCGLVVGQHDMKDLDSILKEADYATLKDGVGAFQRYYIQNNPSAELAEFIASRVV